MCRTARLNILTKNKSVQRHEQSLSFMDATQKPTPRCVASPSAPCPCSAPSEANGVAYGAEGVNTAPYATGDTQCFQRVQTDCFSALCARTPTFGRPNA